jgi:hypothetical protein
MNIVHWANGFTSSANVVVVVIIIINAETGARVVLAGRWTRVIRRYRKSTYKKTADRRTGQIVSKEKIRKK